jgi:hypothetical protein
MNNQIAKFENITSKQEVEKILIETSKSNKGVICASIVFNTVRIYKYDRKSQIPVDSPQSRTMLEWFGGIAFENGILVQPTKSWMVRNNRIPMRD